MEGSPWKHYSKAFGLELGGSVAIVCKKPATFDLFAMHSCSGDRTDEKVCLLRQLKHENLLETYELFSFEDSIYIISACGAISLDDLIVARPDEVQLAAIVHQVGFVSLVEM